eukprot:COSAG02_NODE_29302_length_572_cov_0.511628_1_plen_34_part_10
MRSVDAFDSGDIHRGKGTGFRRGVHSSMRMNASL